MKTEHTIKFNGEWYRAGSEIPALTDMPVKEITVEENTESVVNEEPQEEVKEEKLTKSGITLMNVAGLRELGAKNGIENVEELTGSELKRILIEKLGL